MHQYMLGTDHLESKFAEKLLVCNKLTMSHQCALVAKKDNSPELHQEGCCQQVERGDPSPLLSTGEATSAVLCPVLGSSAQERHGRTGVSSAKGHKDH